MKKLGVDLTLVLSFARANFLETIGRKYWNTGAKEVAYHFITDHIVNSIKKDFGITIKPEFLEVRDEKESEFIYVRYDMIKHNYVDKKPKRAYIKK